MVESHIMEEEVMEESHIMVEEVMEEQEVIDNHLTLEEVTSERQLRTQEVSHSIVNIQHVFRNARNILYFIFSWPWWNWSVICKCRKSIIQL